MAAPYFPLRWQSTGDQWWYVSPIDCAAANGQYDLVRELLYIDANLLIKLTSLRRIRRLETVWDGGDSDQVNDVAKCRAFVAKNLLLECESEAGHNSLIRAGYGGWLLYTAAAAGDLSFVQDLLQRDPLLVFGEGEYGISDVLYAAARSMSSEVFRLLMDSAVGMRRSDGDNNNKGAEKGEFCDGFRWEMINRGVHSAARGGNLDVLKELLVDCCDVLAFRDAQGSTILHSAAGKGQVKVVKHLILSFNMIESTDDQGNTALHIAAYKGFLGVVEALLLASPSLASSTNKDGNTFLHMAVSGFQTPGFHRLDQQLELVRQLAASKIVNIQETINLRNKQGRAALHLAVAQNIQLDVVELLMAVPSIDLNIRDCDGRTPMDLIKQHPQSGSSRLLIKNIVSNGGTVSYREDHLARGAVAAQLKLESGLGNSPGTSFRVPDSEIFLYAANEDNIIVNNSECDDDDDDDSVGFSSSSGEILSQCNSCALSGIIASSGGNRRPKKSTNSAVARLKLLLQWPKRKKNGSHDQIYQSLDETTPAPLRQRFAKNRCSIANNKGNSLLSCEFPPSPCAKKKYTTSLMQGVHVHQPRSPSRLSSPVSSPCSSDKSYGEGKPKLFKSSRSYLTKKSMVNRYLCFGAQGLATAQVN
ncbi:hypothetical protein V2J09_013183 [Rumex salicifolius]